MLLYRADELRYESDYYNRFLAPPERMLTDALRNWLLQARVGEVREPGAPLAADLLVQARLTELYADYRDVERPRAVVAMVMVLIKRDPAGNRQLFEKTYRRAVPMKEVSPRAAVQGWRADRLLAFSAPEQPRDHAVWQTLWAGPAEAGRFFKALRTCLLQRWDVAAETDGAEALRLRPGGREVRLQRNLGGRGVLLVDAADPATASALQATLDAVSGSAP
jgi:hypothetical protein